MGLKMAVYVVTLQPHHDAQVDRFHILLHTLLR